MAMPHGRKREERPPIDGGGLERLALRYVERYATSRGKLTRYLHRKLHERGWEGDSDPPVASIVDRMAALGYVDDSAFAAARATALGRRGLGERRIGADLRAAGIADEDSAEAWAIARDQALAAALRYAQKRRIGPFAVTAPDRAAREKAMAALLRAGHPIDLARRIAAAAPGADIVPSDT